MNDLMLVRRVLGLLDERGLRTLVFGGWAEELLGLRPVGPHLDVDLLCVAQDFATVDSTVREAGLDEIVAKRFPHKRAFALDGVMVELFLVRHDARGWYTEFWGRLRHDWPHDLVRVVAGVPVTSEAALASYRAAHDRLRMGAEPAGARSFAR